MIMRRAAGIAAVATLALVVGLTGLGRGPLNGGVLSPRAAHAKPSTGHWLAAATTVAEHAGGEGPTAGNARLTVRNDMPATITIVTQPDGRTYRVGWGGGDLCLGTSPIRSVVILYHDPYWPYVYVVTCPVGEAEAHLRMSDLWHGRIPQGFSVRCGRPERDGIVWFDEEEGARGQGVKGPRG